MWKKILIIVVLVAFVGGMFFEVFDYFDHSPKTVDKGLVLFYSNQCPHCHKVEAFIAKNRITNKLTITRKELKPNSAAVRDLIDKARRCKMSMQNLPIPFLWTGKKCITGDVPIINYFKQQTGIN